MLLARSSSSLHLCCLSVVCSTSCHDKSVQQWSSSHCTPRLAMAESTRRRRSHPRALGAIITAAVLACNSSRSHAFVPRSGPFSVQPSPSSSGAAGAAARQHQHHQCHQQGRRLQAGVRSSTRNIRSSSSALAGALPADGAATTDHTDGWNPIDGVETGTCSLVGSGPGDPDLLTVAGLRELQSADLVIADRLVSKEILGLVSC